ncbi:hypothetical protein GALMADRAFT_205138 [Galerina marginata CBS 339.88]|uniref:Uncharacterized protein n=1 Tax=Galerina marginata (strain CBS 339.88) TaxID=685588 RepID=A0A067U343_GALM3|nr:hypothetical protein GALMADRAFT_205138 [Galerina marginata CBS 339.88]
MLVLTAVLYDSAICNSHAFPMPELSPDKSTRKSMREHGDPKFLQKGNARARKQQTQMGTSVHMQMRPSHLGIQGLELDFQAQTSTNYILLAPFSSSIHGHRRLLWGQYDMLWITWSENGTYLASVPEAEHLLQGVEVPCQPVKTQERSRDLSKCVQSNSTFFKPIKLLLWMNFICLVSNQQSEIGHHQAAGLYGVVRRKSSRRSRNIENQAMIIAQLTDLGTKSCN